MSTDENKAVVRRFIDEVLIGGDLEAIDEVLAPNYVNRGMGNADLAGFRQMLPGWKTALPTRRFEIEDLVAEGDAVVARFDMHMTDASGKPISARGLTFYRLANGRIVEDEP